MIVVTVAIVVAASDYRDSDSCDCFDFYSLLAIVPLVSPVTPFTVSSVNTVVTIRPIIICIADVSMNELARTNIGAQNIHGQRD